MSKSSIAEKFYKEIIKIEILSIYNGQKEGNTITYLLK